MFACRYGDDHDRRMDRRCIVQFHVVSQKILASTSPVSAALQRDILFVDRDLTVHRNYLRCCVLGTAEQMFESVYGKH